MRDCYISSDCLQNTKYKPGKDLLKLIYFPPVASSPARLPSLLQAAFKLPQHVVGLMDKAGIAEPDQENGVVVPLSLACRAPQVEVRVRVLYL